MRLETGNPAVTLDVAVVGHCDPPFRVEVSHVHVGGYCIDENHAQALVLALQAAIAEIQARQVPKVPPLLLPRLPAARPAPRRSPSPLSELMTRGLRPFPSDRNFTRKQRPNR